MIGVFIYFPTDPQTWSEGDVQQWLEWSRNEFKLRDMEVARYHNIEGRQLCSMNKEQFTHLFGPHNAESLFSHLNFLRHGMIHADLTGVNVIRNPTESSLTSVPHRINDTLVFV